MGCVKTDNAQSKPGKHQSFMSTKASDPYNLERYKSAQDVCYHRVKAELRTGRKTSHWIWFIFPQFQGLGHSHMDANYSIKSKEEAIAYLADGLLAGRLYECIDLLLDIESDEISTVMTSPDDLKLRSSMTLFAQVADNPSPFKQVLTKYFAGDTDQLTVSLLGRHI